ncbi:3,4-dihydroxy-2-butanone-4-phosphate synthase [Arthrobacter sp. PGP41]|uniref:3,4-dihydroxy-2-butanone-4-phosphate synthase n=1 Tax=Arthrobacter sp. PGP41 TaxID=2079227 RepID=UPI000CDC5096|nr:3,4-dihydroxy-2-butanone-4-phosphate synthase [Arthrobacter sp. PGP41]AUZ34396.1 3,4-dihydroxy-2-butanone-4-phosphate synthase [Arthrobacter sp. PGP41]
MNAAVKLENAAAAGSAVAAAARTGQPAAATGLDTIEEAVRAIAAGRPVLAVDNEDRENEGDIIFAAQHATPALMGWTIRYSSGVICVPLSGDRADALALPPMVAVNEDAKGTAYTVSCDATVGVSTGISATDRALTARVLADPQAGPEALTRPGHIFPLRAVNGGVRERPGHTEAAVDLCRLAGLEAVGVIAEVVYDDGEMMRLDGLRAFAAEHGCPLISIEDLVAYLEATGPAADSNTRAGRAGGEEEIR